MPDKAKSTMLLHCGAREVRLDELDLVPVPPATRTYVPVPHGEVIRTVKAFLGEAGFEIDVAKYALTRNDARMFATLDLRAPVASGVSLAVGIRSSFDKSLPLGFACGARTFICDNLAMRSDLLVSRKHTTFGKTRFQEAISQAVQSLGQFQAIESDRIKRFQIAEVTNTTAESVMLRAYERGIVSHRVLPEVLKEWRNPSFEEFRDRTMWSLLSAFTTALGGMSRSNPQRHANVTMSLQGLLDQEIGLPASLGTSALALPAPA